MPWKLLLWVPTILRPVSTFAPANAGSKDALGVT